MARIRTIKPEFFTSEDIVELTPFARLLYIAVWCEADREGRLTWKPKTFKLRYFPADEVNIDQLCQEIVGRGLVRLYGDGLAFIPTFLDHQHINPRESASTLADPADVLPRVKHASARVSDAQVGREGKERKEHASLTQRFERFYEAYPKKKSRGDAEKAWAAINPSEHLAEEILQAVQRAKTSVEWTNEGGRYVPYPASWLRDKGWMDEYTQPGGVVGGAGKFAGAK
jgi:hypothetical protein